MFQRKLHKDHSNNTNNKQKTEDHSKHGKKTVNVQGIPMMGINVLGRAFVGGVGVVKEGVHKTNSVLAKATKTIVTDPLARVARRPTNNGTTTATSTMFGVRNKVFPRRHRNTSNNTSGSDPSDSLFGDFDSSFSAISLANNNINWTDKQEDVTAYLLRQLEQNFLFAELESNQRETLVKAFEQVVVKADEKIIQQGDPGDFFYILYRGSVSYDIDGQTVGSCIATATPPSSTTSASTSPSAVDATPKSFGELALFFAAPRAASVIAETNCVLYRLDQVNFRLVAQKEAMEEDDRRLSLLKQVPVLQDLDDVSRNKLVSAMTELHYTKDEIVFQQGDHMTDFFIVQTGQVQATNVQWGGSAYEDVLIGPGQDQLSFGWQAMIQNEPVFADVKAVADTTVLAIQGETFRRVVGRQDHILHRVQYKRQLSAVAVFRDSKLNNDQYKAILDLLHSHTYSRKSHLIKEGATIDARMLFVRKGRIVVESKSGKRNQVIEAGGYFGQDWLLIDQNKDIDEDSSTTVYSKVSVTIDAHSHIDSLYLDDLRKVVDTAMLGLGKAVQISGLDDTIQIKDVQRHKMLGTGSFGQVWLASYHPPDTSSNNRRVFALKVQQKHQLIESGQAEGVIAEVNIMKCLKSPFIIRLYSTFQDQERVFMLTSLLQGGELEAVMGDQAMDDSVAKFYAGGILEGLTYMHRRHIIHRDLKPENVLINSKGYPVLIDLGFAKYCPDKTYTFCGTPMYIAPEVIQYKGHDKGADHWSWACLVFEMVTAKYPFYEANMAELDLFKKIIRGQFKIYGFMSFEAKLLFISLFVPDPSQRLGARSTGWEDLCNLSFFDGLDFKKLGKQALEAPWVPDLKNAMDASNFKAVHRGVEDKMKTTGPKLDSEQQALFTTFGKMTV